MNTLEVYQMEDHEGGDFIAGLCIGLGAGSVVYAAGAATNFWNPIGWVSTAFLVADAACVGYAASNLP